MDSKQFLRGEIKSADPEDPAGKFTAVLSAPTVDRDGEIIDARAFEPLPEHIPIDIDHGMDTRSTVGSGRPYYDGDLLMFEGRFASTPLGQETRTLVTEGHVRKMSVAFMGAQRYEDEDGIPHVAKAELLNAAVVSIPSNREADILAAKAFEQVAAAKALKGLEQLNGSTPLTAPNNNFTSTSVGRGILSAADARALEGLVVGSDVTPIATADEDEAAAPAPAKSATPALAKAKAALAEAELLLTQ